MWYGIFARPSEPRRKPVRNEVRVSEKARDTRAAVHYPLVPLGD